MGRMPQTVWSGAVSFGLVNVPVKAVSATRDRSVRFSQLHKEDGERIRMKRTCPEHGEVPYDEVVKGFPVSKNEYVVVTKEDVESLEPEKSRMIEIEDFVDVGEVDPVYFRKPYHLIPDETGSKAYHLLLSAMEETGMAAVGRFVLRNREHLVVLRPVEGALVMETMRFEDEVVDPSSVMEDAPRPRQPNKKELEMAVRLVRELSGQWEPEKYEDTFREAILDLVEKKRRGETVKVKPHEEEERVTRDLEKALEDSLAQISR